MPDLVAEFGLVLYLGVGAERGIVGVVVVDLDHLVIYFGHFGLGLVEDLALPHSSHQPWWLEKEGSFITVFSHKHATITHNC